MCDVEVAVYYDGFDGVEGRDVVAEVVLPLKAVGKSDKFGAGIGDVDVDKVEGWEFERYGSAFMVVEVDSDA